MRRILVGLVAGAAILITVLPGCSGKPAQVPAGPASTTAPSPSPSPTPSPRPRTAAQDKAALTAALVSAKDLGSPWLRPKSVSSSGTGGEICPGHRSAAAKISTTASVRATLTKGDQTGASIGSFILLMLPTTDASALRTAYTRDTRTCATYVDTSKLFVVRTAAGPTSLDPAEEVVAAWAERIYYDKAHRKLAYARHVVVARTGRVVTYVEFAFLADPDDPTAQDFAAATELITTQLEKVAQHSVS